MDFNFKKIEKEQFEDALSVRMQVFVDEQGVEPELELDHYDKDALHWVVYAEDKPVGVIRLVIVTKEFLGKEGKQGKLGRLAVLKEFRGHGLAKKLMLAVQEHVNQLKDIDNIILHAQHDKELFYEKLGYLRTFPEDEPFMEDGILHVLMHRSIN